MLKTVYMSLETQKDVAVVQQALVKLLDGVVLDDLGKVRLHRVTVHEHRGSGSRRATSVAKWER